MKISLSKPSKMPCHSWSISALSCKTGAKLAQVEGSVCEWCYALKGNYRFPNVKKAQEERLKQSEEEGWVDAMVEAIIREEHSGFFRWFDAGDLQSLEMLRKIASIARRIPWIKFWLPTKEFGIVSEFLETEELPKNLTIRLSAYMVDKNGPNALAEGLGLVTSEVRTSGETCPAPSQGNKCLQCRACWDKEVKTVVYKKH